MPKEEPCCSEHSSRTTSSKNAKDKSNNTTLLAMRDSKDPRGRQSRCNSEKDSGFSDNSSEWLQTDVEDQRNNKSQSRYGAGISQSGQSQAQRNPGNSTVVPAGHELQPIYIIRKMPDVIQKRGQLLWRNKNSAISGSGATHMILFQQPGSMPSTIHLHKPLSWKTNTTGKKITYSPILNSYPRIAPHPGKKPPDKSSVNNESQNLSKRMYTDLKSNDKPASRSLLEPHLYKQPKVAVSGSAQPCSSTDRDKRSSSLTASSSGPPSLSGTNTTPPLPTSKGHQRNGVSSPRNSRFLNTVEALRQSGLLDITLRTKELMRQSTATERDIAQLRQHTELLCQAACSSSRATSSVAAWEELHRAMAESGGYPDLKTQQNLQFPFHPDSASQPESISTGDADGPMAAANSDLQQSHSLSAQLDPGQRCAVPQQSHTEQCRELNASKESSEKVTYMPPDSSTG